MVQTGVRFSEWSGKVSSYSSSVNGVHRIRNIKLGRTNMAPFTSFNSYISEVNSSLSSFKSYVGNQKSNMIQVGQNKVTVDSQGAQDLHG